MRQLGGALLVAFLVAAGCAKDGGTGGCPASEPEVIELAAAGEPAGSLTLHISNQSFEDDTVGAVVTVDGVEIADQCFFVGDQHTIYTFELLISDGVHTLSAVSDTDVAFSVEFESTSDEPLWASLSYWFSPDEEPRRFTWTVGNEEIGFD